MMKKVSIGLVGLLAVSLVAIGAQPQIGKAKDRAKATIEGTWEKTIENQPNLQQVKIICGGHFLWITYDRHTRLSVASAGGLYKLKGRTYTERVVFGRFGSPELQNAVGQDQTFQVAVEGDRMEQWGVMSTGDEIREVWRRVK